MIRSSVGSRAELRSKKRPVREASAAHEGGYLTLTIPAEPARPCIRVAYAASLSTEIAQAQFKTRTKRLPTPRHVCVIKQSEQPLLLERSQLRDRPAHEKEFEKLFAQQKATTTYVFLYYL